MRAAWRFLDPLPWYEKLVAIAVALFFFGDHLVEQKLDQIIALLHEIKELLHDVLDRPRVTTFHLSAFSKVQLDRLARTIVTMASKLARTESRDPSIHPVASATHRSEVVE